MNSFSSIYRKAFEDECIELISQAYSTAIEEKEYQLDWHENDFSELLGFYVNNSSLSLKKGITCKTEKKILNEVECKAKGFADKLPRIDFSYFKVWNAKRYECYMEAKRLKQHDSMLKRAYINDGMNRYISEKYPVGCMLGYLLEGSAEDTVKGINSLLNNDGKGNEKLNFVKNKQVEFYYESTHGSVGKMKHLIFDFT